MLSPSFSFSIVDSLFSGYVGETESTKFRSLGPVLGLPGWSAASGGIA